MSHYLKSLFLCLSIVLLSNPTCADPWFTGPIFAGAGHTIPRGHTNLEVYGIDVFNNGRYDSSGHVLHTPLFKSILLNPLLSQGLTDWMDAQFSLPYVFNTTQGVSYNRIADTSLGIGLQIIEQRKHKWLPDFRLFVQEVFPTGKFDQLNPLFLGTDATGLGSYRTNVSLNFQYLSELFNAHYLRTRLVLSRLYSSPVQVIGLNSFGGTARTNGTINPGTEDDIDLAFEFTLTQHWVAVMEGYVSSGQTSNFNGILNNIGDGTVKAPLGTNYYEQGLAPAIEYNFTSNVGVIGGVWFPINGNNTSHFISYVLAINAYW